MKLIQTDEQRAELVARYTNIYKALTKTTKQLGKVLAARLELFNRDGNEKPLMDGFFTMAEATQKAHEALLQLQGKPKGASKSAEMGGMIGDMKRAFDNARQIVEEADRGN